MAGAEQRTGIDDIGVEEVWERLAGDRNAVLVDVRTQAEWVFVGLPDVSVLGKNTVTVEWQTFPDGQVNPSFVEHLGTELQAAGAGPDTPLFFICRSGSRSRAAARAMAASGYRRCHNVADGFEGSRDTAGHRGSVSGWKAAGLPWVQG